MITDDAHVIVKRKPDHIRKHITQKILRIYLVVFIFKLFHIRSQKSWRSHFLFGFTSIVKK
jgi:hypothetical protein